MRALKFIFSLIFLTGMLYTVFNYVPIIEEEVSSKKHEQHSSAKTDGDGEGGDDDNENGSESLFQFPVTVRMAAYPTGTSFLHYLHQFHTPPFPDLHTPPPRIAA